MCLLFFSINPAASSDEFYLILVNVRDEIYNRPTQLADFWEKHPNIIGGMDIEPGKEGGTWLAMSKTGKLGALLNILQPDDEILPDKKGRGFLVVDYVAGKADCFNYLNEINSEKQNYNGFLLVTMDFSSLKNPTIGYFTNISSSPPTVLKPGIHAFGNSVNLETPWPKVTHAKEMFTKILQKYSSISSKKVLVEDLFTMLLDQTRHVLDENMKKQGRSKSSEFMEQLSAIHVQIPEHNYGSRCHTVILIDGSGNVDYYECSREEQSVAEGSESWESSHYSFKLLG